MALTSPALTLATEAMFGSIKPALDLLRRIGPSDFSAGAPEYVVKPGATIKVPVSSIEAAQEYNASTNNYTTGGDTSYAAMTCALYLKGYDVSGVNVDEGVNASRIEQLFTRRAGTGIAYAIQGALKTALDGTTASTGVTIPAVGSATLDDYMGLATAKDWYSGLSSALVVNGTEFANIKALFASKGIVGSEAQLASYIGFKDLIVAPGMTARAVIVPDGSVGFLARVPAIVANYPEFGVETDEDTGLSVGIVIADDQTHNRRIANANIWFGAYTLSANAAATTAGAIKVGTAA